METLEGRYRVLKFGGSSLGSVERLEQVVEIIAQERATSAIAVVVSAMGDTTDWLLEACRIATDGELAQAEGLVDRVGDLATRNALVVMERLRSGRPGAADTASITPLVREFLAPLRQLLLGLSLLREQTAQSTDLVLSFGERLSAQIVSALVEARGLASHYVDGRRWVETDARFGNARVDWPRTEAQLRALVREWGDAVSVHTGFIGQTPDGRTTTLGRNGSDYTATLLGRALTASEVVVCTDVSGVMTADPSLVADAYPVAELANYGARMFHPRTMLPLIESQIPMRIRNTMAPQQPGTRIASGHVDAGDKPTCVTSLENLALVDLRWRKLSRQAQVGERALRALAAAQVPVWMATQSAHGQALAVAVPQARVEEARAAIEGSFSAEIGAGELEPLEILAPVTLLSLVAEQLGSKNDNVAGRFFGSLGAVGINVLAIAQGESSRSISCIIDAQETAVAVRAVHAAFNFAHQQVSLLIMGKGVVGGELLEQIREQGTTLRELHDVELRVVGIADSRRVVVHPEGLELGSWQGAFEEHTSCTMDEALEQIRRLPVPIVVDCTAADDLEELYARAFARGVHVVAANKKPLTTQSSAYNELMRQARRHHRLYHYETTVGASLPVIETLKNLVRTGDRVALIEGAFSGTLGYLCNEVMREVPLSVAVRRARELGYTEPQPQDDLSGLDVARKALILARELGYELTIEDVDVQPLVPSSILEHSELDAFYAALEAYDGTLLEAIRAMAERGETWRYLARIEPLEDGGLRCSVAPVAVAADHPATSLRGAEAFVAFTTARFKEYPLIVRGAGAGGAVTAAGVLSDVLRIAQALRGR